jgi:hypothetical protein
MGPGLGGNLPSWIPSKILAMASGRAALASCSPLTVWVVRPELAGRAASMDGATPYPVHFESIRCARPLLLRSRRTGDKKFFLRAAACLTIDEGMVFLKDHVTIDKLPKRFDSCRDFSFTLTRKIQRHRL